MKTSELSLQIPDVLPITSWFSIERKYNLLTSEHWTNQQKSLQKRMEFVSELSGKHKGLKPGQLRGGRFASFKTEEEASLTLT